MAVGDQRVSGAGRAWPALRIPDGVTYRVASVLLMLLAWQVASILVSAKYVPGPWATFAAILKHAESGVLATHFLATMFRMLSSFALAMGIGVVLGIVMGLFRRGEQMLDLLVMVGLTIPSLCYVIISFLWLGLNDSAAILAIAWTTFPSITINIWQGVKAIDQRLIDMARAFRASRWQRISRVVLPQVLPYLMAATRFGLGVVWKVTVLVELLGRSDGIGYMLNYSFQMFNMVDVFAWTLSFTVFMLAIELGVLKPLERKLFRWRPEIRG
jgi:NitT/TauT family transport system permease protein